jgi:hypothetical protein
LHSTNSKPTNGSPNELLQSDNRSDQVEPLDAFSSRPPTKPIPPSNGPAKGYGFGNIFTDPNIKLGNVKPVQNLGLSSSSDSAIGEENVTVS